MAHTRQSRPDSGLGSQVQQFKLFPPSHYNQTLNPEQGPRRWLSRCFACWAAPGASKRVNCAVPVARSGFVFSITEHQKKTRTTKKHEQRVVRVFSSFSVLFFRCWLHCQHSLGVLGGPWSFETCELRCSGGQVRFDVLPVWFAWCRSFAVGCTLSTL